MKKVDNVVYLSYSGASTFKTCPEKYYLSRIYKEKGNYSYFVFGSSVENGVTAAIETRDYDQAHKAWRESWEAPHIFDNISIEYGNADVDLDVIESKSTLILDWAHELFPDDERTWQSIFFDTLKDRKAQKALSVNEVKFYNRLAWLTHMVKGDIFIEAFCRAILPQIKRLVVIDGKPASQYKFDIVSDEGDKLTGYVDYVVELNDGTIVVLDCKTAASPYDSHKLLTSEQLKTYAAYLSGKLDTELHIGYLVFVKKLLVEKSCSSCGHVREESKLRKCTECGGKYDQGSYSANVQFEHRPIEEEEMDGQMDDYSNVAAAIKAGVRYKNPESCFSFGRKCPYYDYCHNGTPLEELDTIELKNKRK